MQKTGNPVFCFLPFLAFSRFSPRHLCASVPLRWGLKSNAIALRGKFAQFVISVNRSIISVNFVLMRNQHKQILSHIERRDNHLIGDTTGSGKSRKKRGLPDVLQFSGPAEGSSTE